MGDDAAEYEGGEEGEGDYEAVEEAVVASAHAVPHPRAVVVEPLWKKWQGFNIRKMSGKTK